MAVDRTRLRISLAVAAVLLAGAAVTTAVLLHAQPPGPAAAEGVRAEVTGPVTTASSSSPAPSSPAPSSPAPSPVPPSAPGPGGPGATPTSAAADATAITAFGHALVVAISSGDQATLSQLLCGQLAQEMTTQPVVPDPTVYDRVTDISVAPGGTAAIATVYAYKVQRGPPPRPLRLALQKSGSGWQACSVVGG